MSANRGRPDRPPVAFSVSGRARTSPETAAPESNVPARPAIDEPPPPVTATPIDRPKMLTVCVVVWIASFVLGLAAIALTIFHRSEVSGQLVKQVHSARPSLSVEDQKSIADTLVAASAIAGAVLVLLQLLFVLRLWSRHRRSRLALAPLGLLHIALLILFEDALGRSVSLPESSARLNASGHAAMIVLAMITTFWPSIGSWLRRTSALYAEDEE